MAKKSKRDARMERESVLWHALAKRGGTMADRELLTAGARHRIEASVSGTVDGEPVCLPLSGHLVVNHDQERASSTGPAPTHVLALALAKLPARTRTAFLDNLELDKDGQLPAADKEIAAACEHLLKRLRQPVTQHARGSVRFEADPPLEAA